MKVSILRKRVKVGLTRKVTFEPGVKVSLAMS